MQSLINHIMFSGIVRINIKKSYWPTGWVTLFHILADASFYSHLVLGEC